MKILHVTKKYPPAVGGDAVVVSQLQKHQQNKGHLSVIVTSNCEAMDESQQVYTFGLKDTPENLDAITLRRLFSLVALCFKMFGILQKERPDVIHTHSIDMAFFVSFAARFYRIPLVHTFHIVTFYDKQQAWVRRISELWLARRAHLYRVTAPNMFDVEQLRHAGLTQTVLLPNGVDIDFWENNVQTEGSGTFQFISIGRLEEQKGYEYLIKAVSLLMDTSPPPFHVTVVGDGSLRKSLEEMAKRLQVDEHISFIGRKDAEEIRTILSGADAAISPSLYETTPLTLLEAWAASVPVIMTPVGIMRGSPAETSMCQIVPVRDERALMLAMDHFLKDIAARRTLARKGYAEVQQYAWPNITQVAETIYRGAK